MELRYWILLIVLGAVWGSAFMFLKIATPEVGPIFLINARLLVASLIFLPFLLQKKYLLLLKGSVSKIIVLSLFNNSIPFVMFSFASLGSDSSMLAILNSSTALMTTIIAFIWLGERINFIQIFGLIFGFFGLIILINPSNVSISIISSIACLVGAACYAFSNVFIQKYSAKLNKLVLIGWSLVFGTISLMPFTIFNMPEKIPSTEVIYSILWLGGICTGIAFIGYIRMIEKVGAVKTATVAYLLPVFGIIWGSIFLNEKITLVIIIGCTMVLAGIFLATRSSKMGDARV